MDRIADISGEAPVLSHPLPCHVMSTAIMGERLPMAKSIRRINLWLRRPWHRWCITCCHNRRRSGPFRRPDADDLTPAL